jgi:preprotein translocase subunit SecF
VKLLGKTNFDFVRIMPACVIGSLVINALALGVFFTRGLNMGIDFTGGAELQLRFSQAPDLARVRAAIEAAGLKNPTVTTIGDPADNELYLRVASEADVSVDQHDQTRRVLEAVRGVAGAAPAGLDVNIADERALTELLSRAPGATPETAKSLASGILAARRERSGLFKSLDDLRTVPGMTDPFFEGLKAGASAGPIAIRSQNFVGPSVAPELRQKALWAVVLSIFAMLAYIWFRFRLQWGLGAILALVHDVIFTLGLFSLSGLEFSLPVVASFLTLVGYSVNDTIVVFDRIRENQRSRGMTNLAKAINDSINQTLSRTVITSFLTWMVCVALFLLGGDALKGFSFVLVVGIIVGTYSSIFIASPVILFWEKVFASRRAAEAAGRPQSKQGAKQAPKQSAAQPSKKSARR